MDQHITLDPDYVRTALRSHHQFAERCRALIATATTEDERSQAIEQLQSALNEIRRWKAEESAL